MKTTYALIEGALTLQGSAVSQITRLTLVLGFLALVHYYRHGLVIFLGELMVGAIVHVLRPI